MRGRELRNKGSQTSRIDDRSLGGSDAEDGVRAILTETAQLYLKGKQTICTIIADGSNFTAVRAVRAG